MEEAASYRYLRRPGPDRARRRRRLPPSLKITLKRVSAKRPFPKTALKEILERLPPSIKIGVNGRYTSQLLTKQLSNRKSRQVNGSPNKEPPIKPSQAEEALTHERPAASKVSRNASNRGTYSASSSTSSSASSSSSSSSSS